MKTNFKFFKTTLLVLFVALIATSGLFAAGSSESTKKDEVVIEFQQWWAVELPDGYMQNIVDEYYEKTGVRVKLLSAPFADTKTAIMSGLSSNTVADIISVDGSWLYDFADQGVLTNMSKLMTENNTDQSLFTDQWRAKGSAYALPVLNFAYPMFVNMDILKASGVTELPETWSDFLDVCDAIASNGYYPFALNLSTSSPSGIQNVYMGYAWASNITMKDENGNYAVAGDKDMIEFAEFYKTLYERGYLIPGMSAITEQDMTSKFISGEVAFIINSMAVLQAWRRDNPNLEIATVGVPVRDGYDGKSGMCVASWAVGITESSKHKAEALAFVEYLFGGELNAGLAETQSAFPGSSLANPDYSTSDPVFQDVYGIFAEGFPINEFTGMKKANVIMVEFINALIPYMEGDVSVEKYLENVQEVIDTVYSE